jgi:hypothetical protein
VAIQATTVWRVRPSGNNLNGGGYDPAVSGVLATTLSGTLATGATSASITSATGWPGSGNYYARLGATISGQRYNEIVQVTAGQGTGPWTVTRARLGTSDPGVTWPAGTVIDNDLSQCDTAMATGTAGTSNASTTFSDVGLATNTTFPGNILWLASGTNGTVNGYVIQSVTNATTIVLDRNCSTGAMANGVWKIGGGWADPQTNLTAGTPIPAGDGTTVYMLGSGIPIPSSYTYDYSLSAYATIVNGSLTSGYVRILGDPCTPNYASGAKPCIQIANAMVYYNSNYLHIEDVWIVPSSAFYTKFFGSVGDLRVINCVFDQFGYDVGISDGSANPVFLGSWIFSSVAKRSTNVVPAITCAAGIASIINCNVSGCIGPGVLMDYQARMMGSLISKNGNYGIKLDSATNVGAEIICCGNTIDANAGDGILITGQANCGALIYNNIISNHTTAGTYPIKVSAGTTAQNDRIKNFIDYNVFYNNLNAPSAISYGAHDTTGGANPYVDQTNNDYTLTSTYINTGYPQTNFPGY